MRVVAGKYKGMQIISPPKSVKLRPTSDKIREALFDVIRFDLVDTVFVDLFAGSGAVGIEAISEGANFVYFVEKNRIALETIKENIQRFGIQNQCQLFHIDVFEFLKTFSLTTVDFVFLDPPYRSFYSSKVLEALVNFEYLSDLALVIAEHLKEEKLLDTYSKFNKLEKFKEKEYGNVVVSFFVNSNKEA